MLRPPLVHALPLALALGLTGCRSTALPHFRDDEAPQEYAFVDTHQREAPVVDTEDGNEWVRLKSGEWLQGEVTALDRDALLFDSDELDELKLDWEDVVELRTRRPFAILLEDRRQLFGVVHVLDDHLYLGTVAGTLEIPRDDVVRLIPGDAEHSVAWSGKLSIGGTGRQGNTDQVDSTAALSVMRRTARSRLPLDYAFSYGEVDGSSTARNQRLTTQYDHFLDSQIYVTPVGLEAYSDPFQNIDWRLSPFTAVGYQPIESGWVTWDNVVGLGWRLIRFESVQAGENSNEDTPIGVLTSTLTWEPSSDVDVELSYSAQMSLEDSQDTNQTTSLDVSVDLWGDLDLDVRFTWNRVGKPVEGDDDVLPQKDDYLLTVGLSYEF